MDVFLKFLDEIEEPAHKERTKEVLTWVHKEFPNLIPEIKWNQPMFTNHGTFIIAFSLAKQHLAVAPEKAGVDQFSTKIKAAGYDHTKQLIRIPWTKQVDYHLLKEIIEFNIMDKSDCLTFWRKEA